MKVLLIGGTGYIGRLLVSRLQSEGHYVCAFGLPTGLTPLGADVILGDRDDIAALKSVARYDFDAVVDLAAYLGEQTKMAIQIFEGKIGRFIHLGTVAAYSHSPREFASESDLVRQQGGGCTYGGQKALCEEVLEEAYNKTGFPYVILRASPIHGPADPVSRENYFVKRMAAGRSILHPGPLDGRVLLLFAADLVEAVANSLTSAQVIGKAYHLCHADCPTVAEHIGNIASYMQIDAIVQEIDLDDIVEWGFSIWAFPYAFAPYVNLDISLARADLSFSPTPYQVALEETLRGLAEIGHKASSWPGRGTRQSRLCGTHPWLHEALEQLYRLRHIQARPISSDGFLEQLCGSSAERISIEVLPLEAGTELSSLELSEAGQKSVVLAPDEFRKHVLGPEPPQAVNTQVKAELGMRNLTAVIERTSSERSGKQMWLYTAGGPTSQQYSHNCDVAKLHLLNFREALPFCAPPDEYAVVAISTRSDAEAFVDWLMECHLSRELIIESMEMFCRTFMVNVWDWLPFLRGAAGRRPISGYSRPNHTASGQVNVLAYQWEGSLRRLQSVMPWAGIWSCAHVIARILVGRGIVGKQTVRISTPDSPFFDVQASLIGEVEVIGLQPKPMMLLSVSGDFFFCDVFEKRLFQVPETFAILAELDRQGIGTQIAIDALAELSGSSLASAKRTTEAYRSQLKALQHNSRRAII